MMALYDYHCDTNGRTIEVRHGMSDSIRTWGELCAKARIDTGDTPADIPVRRLMGTPVPLTGGSRTSESGPPCGTSCGCAWDA